MTDKKVPDIKFAVNSEAAIQQIPEQPKTEFDERLSQKIEEGAKRETLICMDLLEPDVLQQKQAEAKGLYPKLISDRNFFLTFGDKEVDAMNSLVDQMRSKEKKVDIPELGRIMKQASESMRGLKRYDVTKEEISKQIDAEINGTKGRRFNIKALFTEAVSILEEMRLDMESVEQQIDATDARLIAEQTNLMENIKLQDILYVQNEQELVNLVKVIATMEIILNLAKDEMDEIKVDPNDNSQRNLIERRRVLADFIQMLEAKMIEYKSRMFLGWAGSREIMNDRTLYIGLTQKLHHQMKLTVPSMKLTVLRWQKQIEARQSALVTDTIANLSNEWAILAAEASADAAAEIAEAAYSPIVTAETIEKITQSVNEEAQIMFDAYQSTGEKRAALNDAMARGQRLMQNKEEQINDLVLDDLVEQAKGRLTS